MISSASAIALGTYTGGWRIIRTMGTRIIKMDPAQGFAAQGAGSAVILAASHFGYPLSTTHVISGGVMGAGAAKRLSAVRWGVAGNIVAAWVLTLPAAGAIGAAVYGLTRIFGTGALGPAIISRWARVARGCRIRAPHPASGGHHSDRGIRIQMPAGVLGTIVDTKALLDVVWASLAAGVGGTAAFSLATCRRDSLLRHAP